jgi:hypothetical protein
MRRAVLAALALAPLGLLAPHASASQVPPICQYSTHGCDFKQYVYDVCENNGVNCQIR